MNVVSQETQETRHKKTGDTDRKQNKSRVNTKDETLNNWNINEIMKPK